MSFDLETTTTMDDQRFWDACQLREQGKLVEAYHAFSKLAEETTDRIDKAGVLLHAAKTLKLLEQYEEATAQLSAVRALVADSLPSHSAPDERVEHLEIYLDYEDADLCWKQGKNEEALTKFERALERYKRQLREPDLRGFYEIMQTCRAFILADLDRWREAMPILEDARAFTEYKEGIAFYLGHCYLSAGDYGRAEEKLTDALKLGLPNSLEYRAYCELGITYYELRDYAKAKQEFAKCAERADASYINQSQIWKWLESTCRNLGLRDEAERYARLAVPS